jgi:aspartate 1-decarboxylase
MRAKIHRAVITQADLHYVGSISIDPDILKAANILEGEAVEIYNVTNGNRFKTYAILGEKGQFATNGAAAHLARPGDIVIIASYAYLSESEIPNYKPSIVILDGKDNRIIPSKSSDR